MATWLDLRFWVVILIAMLLMGVLLVATHQTQINLSLHALDRHGNEALMVKQCLDQKGPLQVWQQPNGRIAKICQLDNGKFGILIEDANGNNITAFVKNKSRTLQQVIQYLRNKGAQLLSK
ncbi:hypothetical protein C4588_04275 [Candidatus Parcubacteria bacterium]|jgi:putative hemolysin|nr:MAG: hypothetical protein C4588_04275 [Candidatus Parcubacteria bacterium]